MDTILITLPNHEGLIIGGAIILLFLIFRVAPLVFSKGTSRSSLPLGTPRDYGVGGGTICPRCHRPFRLQLFGVKVGLGYIVVRCEFCGKVSISRRYSLEELRAAEVAELRDGQSVLGVSGNDEDQKMRDLIDDSRFVDKS